MLEHALTLHSEGKTTEAREICLQILREEPNHFEALQLLGALSLQAGQYEASLALFDKALSINNQSPPLFNNRGVALHRLQRSDKALENFNEALRLNPNYPQALFNRANALKALKKNDEALQDYDHALKINPSYAQALNNRGNLLKEMMRFEDALDSYKKSLLINPNYEDALNNQGNLLQELKLFDIALINYEKMIEINPRNIDALNNRGVCLHALKRYEDALQSYALALAIAPQCAEAYFNKANALKEMKKSCEALADYETAIKIKPSYAEAFNNRGLTLQDLGRLDEALECLDKALGIAPNSPEAMNNRGVVLKELHRYAEALRDYDEAIRIQPNYVHALNNRGNVLLELKQFSAALDSYQTALYLQPDSAYAHYNRGNALRKLGRLNEALESYETALHYKPDYASALNNKGTLLNELKRLEEALACYEGALLVNPSYADALNNKGNVLFELRDFKASLESYDKALKLQPDFADALNNRGNVLWKLNQFDDAIQSYDKALHINPNFSDALYGKGNVMWERGHLEDALELYNQILEIEPSYKYLQGDRLSLKMNLCNWDKFDEQLETLTDSARRSLPVTRPFSLLSFVDSPELQEFVALNYSTKTHTRKIGLGGFDRTIPNKKIRLGYYSPDFREHAVSYLSVELFEKHDRDKFEVLGFSFGRRSTTPFGQRIQQSFDEFIDVSDKSDREIAELSRQKGIHIAIDLAGYTKNCRPDIFSFRAAPIQVNYLGYMGTLGACHMDYIIADKIVIPPRSFCNFIEKVIYLPNCYQVSDSRREVSNKPITRSEFDLPERSFVFCCLNNSHKIHPAMFQCWIRILHSVKQSVLWLLADNPTAKRNLIKEAKAQGIDETRLVFATRANNPEYLARFKLADLFLDTYPYNAGTTANDALYIGLPVLTIMGKSMVSRMASSLLNTLNLNELVTHSQKQYELRAIEFARNPQVLGKIKTRLIQNKDKYPLFKTDMNTRDIEKAYLKMYERFLDGLPPEHIEVF